MKKRLFVGFFILNSFLVFSQDAGPIPHILFISADYSSNTNTFGVTQSTIKQPNLATTVNFFSKYNFDLSYSLIVTDNADSSFTKAVPEHDISADYTFEINDKLTIYPGYTHMFHSKKSFALKSLFTDIAQTDFSYFGKIYNGSLSLNYMFGNKDMFFGTLQNALSLEKENILFKNSLLNVQFGFYLNISDNNYYNKYIYDSWTQADFISWVYENYSLFAASRIYKWIEQYGLDYTKQQTYEYLLEKEPDLFSRNYTLTSIDFYIPVYYSIGSFSLNTTAYLSVPVSQNEFIEIDNSFSLSCGISYAIDL